MNEEEIKEALAELAKSVKHRDTKHAAEIAALETKLKMFEAKSNREQLGLGGANGDRLSGSRMERTTSRLSPDEHKALEHVFRGGDPREVKSLNTISGPAGGYTVPTPLWNEIARLAQELTPMRQLAKVIPNAAADLVLPVCTSGVGAAWRQEGSTRSETTAPTFGAVNPKGAELSAVVRLTRELVQDSSFDIVQFVVEEAARSFAVAENDAFINGNGVAKPSGLFAQTMVEGAATWPQIGFKKSGSAASIADASGGPGGLYDMVSLLAPEYRARASFLASGAAIRELRTLEDSAGNALWAPSLAAGDPATLLGRPIYECNDLPTPAANAFPLWLGDWARAFVILDVAQPTFITDPYSQKGFVLVEIARRVKSAVYDSTAAVALKCAA